MICPRPVKRCPAPECGDVLIHQTNRGPTESSSAFGQFVFDEVGRLMYWSDVDGVIYRRETAALRIVEHKRRGGSLSDGQKKILSLLAKSLQLLAATGLIHEQSGVFVVYSDPPYETGGLVKQFHGSSDHVVWRDQEMSGRKWLGFLQGEVVDIDAIDVGGMELTGA
jgi:hypothetical protein